MDNRQLAALRKALLEIRTSVETTKGATSTMRAIDKALASEDEQTMREALMRFDMLETKVIQRLRENPPEASDG